MKVEIEGDQTIKNLVVSFVIPSRNSAAYLFENIKAILEIKNLEFEIIVSVNHSNDDTLALISSFNDSRIRIIQPDLPLQMAQNYNFALGHAKGEWILLLGSDDAALPNFANRFIESLSKFPNAEIISWKRAYYYWPGVEDQYGLRAVRYFESNKIIRRNSPMQLYAALLGFKEIFDLPQLYTCSLVKRSLILKCSDGETEKFYKSIIPDVYSSVPLLLNTKNYVYSEKPLSLVGTSVGTYSSGDRIYIDSLQGDVCKRIELDSTVYQPLHSMGIGPYYLLEAIRRYSQSRPISNLRLLSIFAYAGTLRKCLRSRINRRSAIKVFAEALISDSQIRSFEIILVIFLGSVILLFPIETCKKAFRLMHTFRFFRSRLTISSDYPNGVRNIYLATIWIESQINSKKGHKELL